MDLNKLEQEKYDLLISFINDCLEDSSYTIKCLINLIDELIEQILMKGDVTRETSK